MSIITITICPVCGSSDLKRVFDVADHFSSGELFPVYDCNHCGFRLTNDFPSEDTIGRYYDSPDYISHSDSDKGLVNQLYHLFRKQMLKKKVNLIASQAKEKPVRLLDIGCGTGYFLQAAHRKGWSVTGIEKDDKARQSAINRTGLMVMDENSFWKIEKASFNVVTLWHVLEHMEKPVETIAKIKEILIPDGVLALALPNHHSFDAKIYQKEWAAYDVPRHLWHFSPESVEKLLSGHRLKIIKRVRMPLDAFYISLLSEKYRGSNPLLRYSRAFGVGSLGFLRSLSDISQSSSVIYLVKSR